MLRNPSTFTFPVPDSVLACEPTISGSEGMEMPDPVTIGALAALAISTAVGQLVKTGVGEGVKDAYKALKEKVSHWALGEVAALEEAPASKGKQLAVAEIIDEQSEDDKWAVRALTETLLARLKESAPAIGLDISRVTDLETQLGNITVIGGIGVRLQDAHGGNLTTGDISVGDPGKK